MNPHRILLPLALLAGAALSGCATTETKEPGKVVNADEYEYVTPLGSNIPQRVKKGTAAKSASPTATMSGDAAQNMMHSAPGQAMADPSGGK